MGVIVDGQGQARLDTGGQLAGDGLQALALGQQNTGLLADAHARLGQHRIAAATIEQLEPQIYLQIGDGGADHRLRLAQLARRRRKGACLCGDQQRLELFQ